MWRGVSEYWQIVLTIIIAYLLTHKPLYVFPISGIRNLFFQPASYCGRPLIPDTNFKCAIILPANDYSSSSLIRHSVTSAIVTVPLNQYDRTSRLSGQHSGSYNEGRGIEFGSADRLILAEVFMSLLSRPGKFWNTALKWTTIVSFRIL
jgi:hypothetical protein